MSWKQKALQASRTLNLVDDKTINNVLLDLADEAITQTDLILAENAKDLALMEKSSPLYDRLMLDKERIAGIAGDIRNVASLPSPLGKVLLEITRPNGMRISKLSVPFGVVGIIYEARPNVSFDVFSLCFKSGNVCVLKGGSDAYNSNKAIVQIIKNVLAKHQLDTNIVTLLSADREATTDLMNAVGFVDMLIPRGGKGLINYVRDNSKVPVIETGEGICHVYMDEFADIRKAEAIILNAKTRRVSVCNALECLIIHESRLQDLSKICDKLVEKNVTIYADEPSYKILKDFSYPYLERATDESYGVEFLDYKLSIKTASSTEEAINHINTYGSKHSESIISENEENLNLFKKMVDAACVYSNVSTAFTDGAQFGLGAEIGISTQKLHARGPMALEELCSYKWIIEGEGQTRS